MQYTKKDLKNVDAFALILIGIGILFIAIGLPQMLSDDQGKDYGASGKAIGKVDVDGARSGKKADASRSGMALTVLGGVFVLLGIALNLGVRRVIHNNGKDIEDYAGVPETLPNENG